MKWSLGDFFNNAVSVWRRYTDENSWFLNWGDPGVAIFNAWKLYRAANQNALGFLILGDAKIRTNEDLLVAFGLASGSGVEEKDKELIGKMTQEREKLLGPRFGNPAVDVVGPGSILNDRTWTPLLNDAFILGGVHGGQDFSWAELDFDANSLTPEKFYKTHPLSSPLQEYYQEKWKLYIKAHSNFWSDDGKFVRVFAREVIGLKTFGYSPKFAEAGMNFRCNSPRGDATFSAYLDALLAVNFSGNDKPAINAALGKFLFNDSNALTTLGSMAKPAGQHH